MPQLSVIVPYKSGDELRQEAFIKLMECIKVQTLQNFELIIVEATDSQGTVFPPRANKLITLKDPKGRGFNKSWLVNVGVRAANTDNILMIDADSLIGKDYFALAYAASQKYSFYHGYNWIVLLPGRDNPITRVSSHTDIKSSGGMWGVNKKFYFEQLGGMNENYFGYGREDSDLWIRATHVLGEIPEMNYPLTHQYHHWVVTDTKDAPGYMHNSTIWKYTKYKTQYVIDKLKEAKLGTYGHPTEIDIDV